MELKERDTAKEYNQGALKMAEVIEDIIRKHMNDNNSCGECSRRKWYQIGYKDGKDDGWIPVEERMPEDGTYLCTLKGELCGIEEPFTGYVWDRKWNMG